MSENKSLIISDEKFIRKMEENSLNPKKNNCSSFGRKDDFLDIKIKANSAEGNEWARVEIEEEENFITKHDPERHKMTTVGGYNWTEFGFHVTSRP